MRKMLIPTQSAEDWKQFLAKPEKHWKSGYSARIIAYCWQEAESFGPTMAEWGIIPSDGKRERLRYLCSVLGLKIK